MKQGRNNLVIQVLHRLHMHGFDLRPFHIGTGFRNLRDIPHPLPGVDGESGFPQRDKRFAGLIHFCQDMEGAPFPGLGRQILDQGGKVRMPQLGSRGQVQQLCERFIP